MKNKWNIGAKIWFVFYILTQWMMFIEYATKPITAVNPAYQKMAVIYGIYGLVGTILILWIAISHKKAALYVFMGVVVISAVINLVQVCITTAVLGLILPGIHYLVTHNHVE